jgi:hypothetical protein
VGLPSGCFEQIPRHLPKRAGPRLLRRTRSPSPTSRPGDRVPPARLPAAAVFEVEGGGFEWFGARAPTRSSPPTACSKVATWPGLRGRSRGHPAHAGVAHRAGRAVDGCGSRPEVVRTGCTATPSRQARTRPRTCWACGVRYPARARLRDVFWQPRARGRGRLRRRVIATRCSWRPRRRRGGGRARPAGAGSVRDGGKGPLPAGVRTARYAAGSSADAETTALAALALAAPAAPRSSSRARWLLSAATPTALGLDAGHVLVLRTCCRRRRRGGIRKREARC